MISGATIFPTVNDIGGGKVLSEEIMRALVSALTRQTDCVVSGLKPPLNAAPLQTSIEAGVAIISGYVVTVPEIAVTLPALSSNYLYLVLVRDSLSHVIGAELQISDSDEVPVDGIPLGWNATDETSIVFPIDSPGAPIDLRQIGWAVHRSGDTMYGECSLQRDSGGSFLSLSIPGDASYRFQIDNTNTLMIHQSLPVDMRGPRLCLDPLRSSLRLDGRDLWHDNSVFIVPGAKYDVANVLVTAPTERSTNSLSFVLLKQFRVARPGSYRVSWEMASSSGNYDVEVRVGDDGGTVVSSASTSYVQKQAVTPALGIGDTVDLYARTTNAIAPCLLRNAELLGVPEEGYKLLKD